MSTSFGAYPLKDAEGNVTVGTTEADIQQIYGSLYTAGIISGGLVNRSATSLTYSVTNGVAAFPIVVDSSTPYKPENQRTVLGPIPATNLTTTAPTSGTRLDLIYAQQLTPTDDNAANVVVRIGTSLPARSVLLNGFLVSAGNTNTNQTVPQRDLKYSIPYGASMGLWFSHRSSFNGNFTVRSTVGSGTFFLPTDRLVEVKLLATLSALGAVKFDNAAYCEAAFDVFIDGIKKWVWTSGGLHQATQEYHWSDTIALNAGTHSIMCERWRRAQPGTPVATSSSAGPSSVLTVLDIGPAI